LSRKKQTLSSKFKVQSPKPRTSSRLALTYPAVAVIVHVHEQCIAPLRFALHSGQSTTRSSFTAPALDCDGPVAALRASAGVVLACGGYTPYRQYDVSGTYRTTERGVSDRAVFRLRPFCFARLATQFVAHVKSQWRFLRCSRRRPDRCVDVSAAPDHEGTGHPRAPE